MKMLYRGFSRQPCWRAETMKQFCMKVDLISQRRENVLFSPSNMAAMTSQELPHRRIFIKLYRRYHHKVARRYSVQQEQCLMNEAADRVRCFLPREDKIHTSELVLACAASELNPGIYRGLYRGLVRMRRRLSQCVTFFLLCGQKCFTRI